MTHTAAIPTVPGISRTVLVAPDASEGTLSANEVAVALGRGIAAGGWEIDLCPVADGGAGTLEALRKPLELELVSIELTDPHGRPVDAAFGIGPTPRRGARVAVIEIGPDVGSDTRGIGELVLAARDEGARLVLLGARGSAMTDGGLGAIEVIRAGGGLGSTRLRVLGDARTSGDRWVALDADIVSGAATVLEAIDFDVRMRAARAVVTGADLIDDGSLAGTLVAEIATRARQAGVPCHAVLRRRELDDFGARILDLQAIIEAGTIPELEAAGRRLAETL